MPDAWFIDREDFLRWNPGIGANCEHFLQEWSYCVEALGEPPMSSTTSDSTQPTPTNDIPTPSPTQPEMVDNCNAFYLVEQGTSCSSVLSENNISLDEFVSWNPSVGENCQSLWANVYVCVSIIGRPTPTNEPTTTPKPSNGIETPIPIQPGMVDNCDAFAFVESGQTCDTVSKQNGISFSELLKWNPQIGKNCEGLWANVYVCLRVIGYTPTPSTTTSPTPTNGVQTPTPTQEGMASNCKTFHLVQQGQTCQVIADIYKISLQDFVNWNPAAKRDCTGLWSNTYACVGLI